MVYKWLDSLLKNKGRYHTIMGKTSRPFPTGHFRLNPKKNASDDTPLVIQLEYVVKGRPIRRSTGYTVKPTDWATAPLNRLSGACLVSVGIVRSV